MTLAITAERVRDMTDEELGRYEEMLRLEISTRRRLAKMGPIYNVADVPDPTGPEMPWLRVRFDDGEVMIARRVLRRLEVFNEYNGAMVAAIDRVAETMVCTYLDGERRIMPWPEAGFLWEVASDKISQDAP